MKNKTTSWVGILAIAALILQSCAADIRTPLIKKQGITTDNTNKGKEILERAWIKQGLDKLQNHSTYSYTGVDTWKGMLGKMSKVWPESEGKMEFKFLTGTFDNQVHFLNGKRSGEKAGFQNWNYYEIGKEKDTIFKKPDPRIGFGLAAFQYFGEMLDRLKQAPIISYAGEGELRGKKYHLVFCTWHKPEPHKEADQYIAWINQENGLMEFTQYTIRDNYLKAPGSKAAYGGVEFSDFKAVDGILVPHVHTVYVFKLKEKQEKNLHQLVITDFKFDDFNGEELRVDKNLATGGNFK
jgi:hypothetical protein